MQKASAKLEFEKAAHLRDQIKELKARAGLTQKEQSSPVDYQLTGKKGRKKSG